MAEPLTDWDERIWLWRFRHYAVVARNLGEDTVGTQGTPVAVLGKLIAQRQLPGCGRRAARSSSASTRGPSRSRERPPPARRGGGQLGEQPVDLLDAVVMDEADPDRIGVIAQALVEVSEYQLSCAQTPMPRSPRRVATSAAGAPSTLTRKVGTRPSSVGSP